MDGRVITSFQVIIERVSSSEFYTYQSFNLVLCSKPMEAKHPECTDLSHKSPGLKAVFVKSCREGLTLMGRAQFKMAVPM